jgi:hypothetical protein
MFRRWSTHPCVTFRPTPSTPDRRARRRRDLRLCTRARPWVCDQGMRILLVESTPGNAEEFGRWLDNNGHESIRCFTTTDQHVCRGMHDADACPLSTPVDATLVVREPGQAPTLTEMGGVCAQRYRSAIVEVAADTRPDAVLPHALGPELLATAIDGYVTAIRRALLDAPMMSVAMIEEMQIRVTRSSGRVAAELSVAGLDPGLRGPVADRVARALRQHDRFTSVIDVSIV